MPNMAAFSKANPTAPFPGTASERWACRVQGRPSPPPGEIGEREAAVRRRRTRTLRSPTVPVHSGVTAGSSRLGRSREPGHP